MIGEEGVNLSEFEPSWMEDGFGIIGEQPDYVDDNVRDWDTNAWTDNGEISPEDFSPPIPPVTCLSEAGDPPGSGEYMLGSVNGTCQWIGTTNCP